MDVYDHAGAAARMAARDRIVSHEIGDGSESARPDPRKGTWNSLLAAVVAASGAPALQVWGAATAVATLIGALAFARLSREFLGRAWPLGALFLLTAHEGGPGGAWFARAAYPGIVGGFLYAGFLAETLASVRGDRSARATSLLLAATLPLVHLMAGMFGIIALGALACVLWFGRRALPESNRAAAHLAFCALAITAVCAWRAAGSGASRNPVQDELQGVLFLSPGIFIAEPRTLFERLGAVGLCGVGAALLLASSGRTRRDLGSAWLVALTAAAAVLLSPLCATLIGTHLSYLLRRIPQLALLPLAAAAGVSVAWGALRGGAGWGRVAAGGAIALLVSPLAPGGVSATRLLERSPSAAVEDEARESEWTRDLDAVAARLPAGARVAADPITSYVLYARSLASPAALPDQHAAPTDSGATGRLAALARALSPWSTPDERRESLAILDATHLLVNVGCGGTVATFGYPVTEANARRLLDCLAPQRSEYRLIASSGALSLFEIPPVSEVPEIGATAPENPHLVAASTGVAARREPTSARLALVDPRLEQTAAAPGDLITVACRLERGAEPPPLGDYLAYLSITSEERRANGGRFAKITRGRRGRAVFERMITQGEYPVLLWRAGETIADRYFIRIPRGFEAGRYVVEMDIQRVPFFQNRTLAGLLGDRDEYARVRVGTIDVVAAPERS